MDKGDPKDSLSGKSLNLLVVDDDKVTRELLREIFEKVGFQVETVPSGEAAILAVEKKEFPIILTDVRMFQLDGVAVLRHVKEKRQNSVVILMTGFGTMEGAIEAIQKGAFDYISKPFKLNELKAVVGRAVKHWESLHRPSEPRTASETIAQPKTLIGKSPQIVEVYKTLARATLSPSNVLIIGESGTGKELVASGIHEHSSRSKKRFVAVNCGALTETLLESELFGHVKGAFTGAVTNKSGLFEEADGGTLFLDEIGDITPALQVKLLRVIQEGEFKPVGSNDLKKVDVRIIAATHRDLDSMVAEGKFREDLFYRLKVVLIRLPALRDRMEDLPELVNHFVSLYSARIGKRISHVATEALEALKRYSWPGNVRELEHAVERAITMSKTNELFLEDFPEEISDTETGSGKNSGAIAGLTSLEAVEREHILRVLEENKFNRSKAAQVLGIDRKTLQRKAARYKIDLN